MEEHIANQIKRYARRQMSEAERAAFENRLETDAAFAEECSNWAAIYQGIQAEGDTQLERQLGELGNKLMQGGEPQLTAPPVNTARIARFQLPRWAYAAAAIVLLLLIAWPVYQSLQPSVPAFASNEAVFEKHFRPPAAPQVRDADVAGWQEAYGRQDYPRAIAELETLLADPAYTSRSEAQLFLGISYLAAGEGQKALASLNKVSPDGYDREDAQWYTALAYIIIDDVVHAKQTLSEIAETQENPYQQEAKEMLEQLR